MPGPQVRGARVVVNSIDWPGWRGSAVGICFPDRTSGGLSTPNRPTVAPLSGGRWYQHPRGARGPGGGCRSGVDVIVELV